MKLFVCWLLMIVLNSLYAGSKFLPNVLTLFSSILHLFFLFPWQCLQKGRDFCQHFSVPIYKINTRQKKRAKLVCVGEVYTIGCISACHSLLILMRQAFNLRDPPVSALKARAPNTYTAAPAFLCGCWGLKLGPHAHMVSPLTLWPISSAFSYLT